MAEFLLAGRLLLATVFAVAGLAKLADREGSRQAIINFGLPAILASPLALLLPLAELAVSAALIPTSTAFWGAVGALGLLLFFIGAISINLAHGRKPDCHCFGQLHSAPAGWGTLARNVALAAVAGLLVWQGLRGNTGPSIVDWVFTLSTVQFLGLLGGMAVLVLLALQWWFLIHLLRQNGRLLVRLEALEALVPGGVAHSAPSSVEGLPVGARAPNFALPGVHGETVTLDALRASDKPVLLLFTDPDCSPCAALLPDVGRWQTEHAGKLSIVLISRGTVEENRARSEEHGLPYVLLQEDREVAHIYKAHGTPSAVLIRPDGAIASPLATGAGAIEDLVTWAVEARAPLLPEPASRNGLCPKCGKHHPVEEAAIPATLEVGEPAPEIELEDLSGESVRLEDFRGKETLVLFWNPGCGFCQQMLPDLKQWERDRPEGAPELLVVSAGTKKANEALDLGSTVALDPKFSAGRAFGADGTPSAVLVDAGGRVASEVAIGAPAVLELAGAPVAET